MLLLQMSGLACFRGMLQLGLAALDCRQFAVGNFNIVYRVDERSHLVNVVAISYDRRLTDFIVGILL